MFAMPECDNMLQLDPQSGEGCNRFLHEDFAKVDTRKRMTLMQMLLNGKSYLIPLKRCSLFVKQTIRLLGLSMMIQLSPSSFDGNR